MEKKVISSPIRWAGSKKRLLNEMLERAFVRNKCNYIECFLGSGVVLLNVLNNNSELNYSNFYVNDINSNIINFYLILQKNPGLLIEQMEKLINDYNESDMHGKERMYYDIREKFNSIIEEREKSIYFYFLMKSGFNGVYRENSKGKFNVPFGKKEKIVLNKDYLYKISSMIKNVHFYNLPYEKFISLMHKQGYLSNSFIYCDPPYLPDDLLVYKKQMLYTKDTFNHIDFVNLIYKIDDSEIMISMSESAVANEIYNKKPFKKIDLMEIIRVVNPKKLFSSKEIAYVNYTIEE